jgi:ATP-dependent RNA helicase DeaD
MGSRFGFELLGIRSSFAQRLCERGLAPSAMQQQLLPALMANQSLILNTQTGTGKTFTLALYAAAKPRLELKRLQSRTQVLFVVPTREIGVQVYNWINTLLPASNHAVQLVIRNEMTERQDGLFVESPPRILVGTPNRIKDLVEKQVLDVSRVESIVFDEIDRLMPLDKKDVGSLLCQSILDIRSRQQVEKTQIIVNSASMSSVLLDFLYERVPDALEISTLNNTVPDSIEHHGFYVEKGLDTKVQIKSDYNLYERGTMALPDDDEKVLDALVSIIHEFGIKKCLLFVSSSVSLSRLVQTLQDRGFNADKLINKFDYNNAVTNLNANIICASEFQARGLDFEIDNVFILGPMNVAAYLHCAGRTGRAGRRGRVFTILGGQRHVFNYLQALEICGISL